LKTHLVESFGDASASANTIAPDLSYSGASDLSDGVCKAQVDALKGGVFRDGNDVISTLQSAISRYLTTSMLASLVDFTALSITLTGATSGRFVNFAELNSDGTEKYPIEPSKPVSRMQHSTAKYGIEPRVHPDYSSNEALEASALDDTEDRHEDAFSGSAGFSAGSTYTLWDLRVRNDGYSATY